MKNKLDFFGTRVETDGSSSKLTRSEIWKKKKLFYLSILFIYIF